MLIRKKNREKIRYKIICVKSKKKILHLEICWYHETEFIEELLVDFYNLLKINY